MVRGEWGFDGIMITDQASYPQSFPALAIRGGLGGGTDLWLNSGADNWQIEDYQNNATVMTQLRQATKHILYAVSQSFAMNGISSSARVVQVTPLWQTWLYALDGAVVLAAVAGVVLIVKKTRWRETIQVNGKSGEQ